MPSITPIHSSLGALNGLAEPAELREHLGEVGLQGLFINAAKFPLVTTRSQILGTRAWRRGLTYSLGILRGSYSTELVLEVSAVRGNFEKALIDSYGTAFSRPSCQREAGGGGGY